MENIPCPKSISSFSVKINMPAQDKGCKPAGNRKQWWRSRQYKHIFKSFHFQTNSQISNMEGHYLKREVKLRVQKIESDSLVHNNNASTFQL